MEINIVLNSETQKTLDGLGLVNKQIGEIGDNAKKIGTTIDASLTPQKRVEDLIKEQIKSQKEQVVLADVYSGKVNEIVKSLGEMQREFRAIKNISFTGKSKEEVEALKDRMGELTQRIKQAKAEAFALGKEGAATMVSGLRFIAAGVEGVVGSLSIMGVESAVIKKLEGKMTALIAVTQSLSEIEEIVRSGKLKSIGLRIQELVLTGAQTVKTWAMTTAQAAYTVVVGASTGALKAFRIALASTGIGLLIIGVGVLINYLLNLNSETKHLSLTEQRLAQMRQSNAEKMIESNLAVAKSRENIKQKQDDETASAIILFEQLKRTNVGEKQRITLIDEINKKYGTKIKNLKDEAKFLLEINAAREKVIRSLINQYTIEANEAEIKANIKNIYDLEKENKLLEQGSKQYLSKQKEIIRMTDKLKLLADQEAEYQRLVKQTPDYGTHKSPRIPKNIEAAHLEYQKLNTDINTLTANITVGTERYKMNSETLVDLKKETTGLMDSNYLLSKSVLIVGGKTKEATDLEANLAALRLETMTDGSKKELQAEEDRYAAATKLHLKEKNGKEAQVIEEKIHTKNRRSIRDKFAEEKRKLQESEDAYANEQYAKEFKASEDATDKYIKNKIKILTHDKNYEVNKLTLEKQGLEEKQSIYAKDSQEYKNYADEIMAIDLEITNAKKEAAKKQFEDKLELAKKEAELALDVVKAFAERSQSKKGNELETQYTKDSEALQKKFDKDLITQEKYDKDKKALDDKKATDKYKLAMKEYRLTKEMAIAKILIEAAVAAAHIEGLIAVSSAGVLTLVFTPVQIAALVALGVETAAQVAIVMATPPPTMGKGGKLAGMPHSLGGTIVEAEKDEWFINRAASQKFDGVLEEINNNNSFGALKELAALNGISIDHNINNELQSKEKAIQRHNLSLNEIPEIREIRDLLKNQNGQVTQGQGYRIERHGNIERKIYEAN